MDPQLEAAVEPFTHNTKSLLDTTNELILLSGVISIETGESSSPAQRRRLVELISVSARLKLLAREQAAKEGVLLGLPEVIAIFKRIADALGDVLSEIVDDSTKNEIIDRLLSHDSLRGVTGKAPLLLEHKPHEENQNG